MNRNKNHILNSLIYNLKNRSKNKSISGLRVLKIKNRHKMNSLLFPSRKSIKMMKLNSKKILMTKMINKPTVMKINHNECSLYYLYHVIMSRVATSENANIATNPTARRWRFSVLNLLPWLYRSVLLLLFQMMRV